jgi:hypothetical protein
LVYTLALRTVDKARHVLLHLIGCQQPNVVVAETRKSRSLEGKEVMNDGQDGHDVVVDDR